MQRTTCSNCGESISDDFSRTFYSMFNFCPKCSNPKLNAEREEAVKKAIEDKKFSAKIEKTAKIIDEKTEEDIEKSISEATSTVKKEAQYGKK